MTPLAIDSALVSDLLLGIGLPANLTAALFAVEKRQPTERGTWRLAPVVIPEIAA